MSFFGRPSTAAAVAAAAGVGKASPSPKRPSDSTAIIPLRELLFSAGVSSPGMPRALLESGFDSVGLDALRAVAVQKQSYLLVRPRNLFTEITERMAMLLGDGVTYKPGAIVTKSGFAGASLQRQSSVREASASAIKERIAAQKSADLQNAPAVTSLDVIQSLIRLNRLQNNPTLYREKITVKNKENPAQSTEVESYYLEFKFSLLFKSKKAQPFRIKVPESWLSEDAKVGAKSLDDAPIIELSAQEYLQRYYEMKQVQDYIKSAEDTAYKPDSKVSELPLPDYYLFGHYAEGKTVEGLYEDWVRLCQDYSFLRKFFKPELFQDSRSVHARIRPGDDRFELTGTKLKSSQETALLTMHAYDPERGCTLPWPIAQKYKELMLGEKGAGIFYLCSDMDLALIASPAVSYKGELPVDYEGLDVNKDGMVTGIGLASDCEVIRAINEQYLKQLQLRLESELVASGGKESLNTLFLRRQIDAGIIAAHHGAENMNPYVAADEIEKVEAVFNEGFLVVGPDGGLNFVAGKDQIKPVLRELAEKKGCAVPMSPAWRAYLFGDEALHKNIKVADAKELSHLNKKKFARALQFVLLHADGSALTGFGIKDRIVSEDVKKKIFLNKELRDRIFDAAEHLQVARKMSALEQIDLLYNSEFLGVCQTYDGKISLKDKNDLQRMAHILVYEEEDLNLAKQWLDYFSVCAEARRVELVRMEEERRALLACRDHEMLQACNDVDFIFTHAEFAADFLTGCQSYDPLLRNKEDIKTKMLPNLIQELEDVVLRGQWLTYISEQAAELKRILQSSSQVRGASADSMTFAAVARRSPVPGGSVGIAIVPS